MAIEAVLFDCDGVLVDSEIVGLEDTAEFLREQGFSWTPEDLIRLFTGKREDRFRKELGEHYGELLGRAPTSEEIESLFDGVVSIRRAKRHTMQRIDGALRLVKAVRESGYAVAVASSSRQEFLDRKINHFGFAPYVDPHIYSADHVDHGKPAPDIFLFAAERLGVPAEACVVIEDSPAGVEAGVAAQMRTWGFTGGGHCLDDHRDRLLNAGAERVFSTHFALQQELASVTEEQV